MNFCVNCGTKKNIDAKFCPNCGQPALPLQPSAQVSTQTKSNLSGAVKKELIQLSNAYFGMYAVSFFLMNAQAEGGLKTTLSDLGNDLWIAIALAVVAVGVAIALTYFTVRVQGINRGKPDWVLGTLIVLGALMVLSWTGTSFSNFNWADWLSQAIDLGQLYVLFSIYQLLKAAKSAQD